MILEAGCGSTISSAAYFTESMIIGLDWDRSALQAAQRATPKVHLVEGNFAAPPFSTAFDLIVIRHPDVDKYPVQWQHGLINSVQLLINAGLLLITTYSATEYDILRGWLRLPTLRAIALDIAQLAPVDLVGRDRFILVYRKESS